MSDLEPTPKPLPPPGEHDSHWRAATPPPADEEELPVPGLGMVGPPTEAETAAEARPPAQEHAAPPRRSWLLLALLPATIALLVVGLVPIRSSALALTCPYQLDREEGFIFFQAMELAQGRTIYPPIDSYPYVVGNYPPVYPLIYAGLMGIFPPSLELGRAIVLFSLLVIVTVLTNIVFRETGRAIAALLAVGLFLATWDVNNWIPFARVDFPAIAFGLLGLMCITSPLRRVGFAAGCLFFTLAFFTKQTQLIAPAAAFAGMIWRREYYRAALFVAVMTSLAGGTMLLVNRLTGGQFLLHTVVYNANEMVPGQLAIWLNHLVRFGALKYLAVAAVLAALLAARHLRLARPPSGESWPRPLHIMPEAFTFLLFSAASVPSIAKVGAAANYLLEFHAAAALLLGLAAGLVANDWERLADARRAVMRAAAGAAVVAITLHAALYAVGIPGMMPAKHKFFSLPPVERLTEIGARTELELAGVTGDILAEEPLFAIRTHHDVLYQPFIMTRLAKEGRWDQRRFLMDLGTGRFEIIVANQDLFDTPPELVVGFTPEMLAVIQARYLLYSRIGGYYLYAPRGSTRQPHTRMIVEHAPAAAPAAAAARLPILA